jgi:serine/threonine protein kinase
MPDDAQPTWTEAGPVDDEPTERHDEVPAALVPPGYRAGALLGVGSQSRVYALDPIGDGPGLAIKVVPRGAPTQRARFDREVDLLGRVRHPNVVRLRDVRHGASASGLLMDRVDGTPLQTWIRLDAPRRVLRLRVFRQLVGAVAALHAVGAVHRDLKPGNVLIRQHPDEGPLACLIDLGIAKSPDLDGITLQGATLGTPGFLSPEQIRDAGGVDHRTDLFALGCLLHLILAGRAPFPGPNPAAILGAVALGHREPIREAADDVPEWLAQLVDALMAREKDDRPRDAAEVKRWLDRQAPPDERRNFLLPNR